MSDEITKKSGFDLLSIVKSLGALAAALPLLLGYFEYQKSVGESRDKNFREIVAHLSSKEKTERLASATNLGTFINEDNPYNDVAIDTLVNMILIESDTDILQAINSSLKRIDNSMYSTLVEKLLKLDATAFAYESTLKYKLSALKKSNDELFLNIKALEKDLQPEQKIYDPVSAADRLQYKAYQSAYEEGLKQEKEQDDQVRKNKFRQELISKFTINFLSNTRKYPIEGLELYQNAWDYSVLSDLKLPKIIIKKSAITWASINSTDFNHALIKDTTFAYSNITGTDFSGSDIGASLFNNVTSLKGTRFTGVNFKDVYFAWANVAGADFTGAKGLEPINFFKAINLEQAVFDRDFKIQLEMKQLDTVSDAEFKQFVEKSTLSKQRINELVGKLAPSDKSS